MEVANSSSSTALGPPPGLRVAGGAGGGRSADKMTVQLCTMTVQLAFSGDTMTAFFAVPARQAPV